MSLRIGIYYLSMRGCLVQAFDPNRITHALDVRAKLIEINLETLAHSLMPPSLASNKLASAKVVAFCTCCNLSGLLLMSAMAGRNDQEGRQETIGECRG